MDEVECVWVRNIFRQICKGMKYFQNFFYGYEIIFYKFGQKLLDCAQFLEFVNFRENSLKKSKVKVIVLKIVIFMSSKSIFGISNYLIICKHVGPVLFLTQEVRSATFIVIPSM